MKKTVRAVLLPALLVATGVAGVKAEQRAYSVPVSTKIVRLEVQVPDGRWIKGAVLEGDQFRVEERDLHLAMAFIPLVKEGGVQIRVFKIEKNADGDESMRFVENLDPGSPGEATYTKKASKAFGVRVVKIVEPLANGESSSPAQN